MIRSHILINEIIVHLYPYIADAGTVYGLRGQVVYNGPIISRVYSEKFSYSADTVKGSTIMLSLEESKVLQEWIARYKAMCSDSLEDCEDLQLPAVLDYLGCDEWISDAVKVRRFHLNLIF